MVRKHGDKIGSMVSWQQDQIMGGAAGAEATGDFMGKSGSRKQS